MIALEFFMKKYKEKTLEKFLEGSHFQELAPKGAALGLDLNRPDNVRGFVKPN